jgi:hypothetical protein
MVTKVAIITIKMGILTISGTSFLIDDITIPDATRTKITAPLITIPLSIVTLTASVGHNPKARTNIGLAIIIPAINCFRNLSIFIISSPEI